MSGKLIVLYGINNLGKSTQAKLLVDKLNSEGQKAEYLKYGLYDLHPSGKHLNAYLREGNPHQLSPREFQLIHVLNRTQYDNTLREKLDSGIWVVAEDYVGTGIAWGVGAGVDQKLLEELNEHLIKEDLGIYFKGKRFLEAKEQNHTHETDDELMKIVERVHDDLAKKHNWIHVNANDSIEQINSYIWRHIQKLN